MGIVQTAQAGFRNFVIDIGQSGMMLGRAFWQVLQGEIDWGQIIYFIDKFGIGSLPIVAVSASFIGMAISVQIARELVLRYGADNLVGGFVAVSMIREMAPVFVAVVMTGNIGASMAAEIGTMKVTEQIDALQVFRVDPLNYLVVPRLISTMIMGPLLTVFGAVLSILAGQLFTEYLVHVPGPVFWDSVHYNTTTHDILNMMLKSVIFSMAISIIASSNGLATQGGSEAVGKSTTRTVVWCLLAIFALNYMITSIFFERL